MCMDDHDTPMDLYASGLGDMEREWLHIVRLHCMSYEHNRIEGWDSAVSHAEQRYGSDHGPVIATRIAVVIRAMRAERLGGFGYLSPHCPSCRERVTEDEWQLVSLMRAGYRGVRHDIEAAATEVARRDQAPALIAAAVRFGAALSGNPAAPRKSLPAGLVLH